MINYNWKLCDILYSTPTGILTNEYQYNIPVGLCVIPTGMLDNNARFIALNDLQHLGLKYFIFGSYNNIFGEDSIFYMKNKNLQDYTGYQELYNYSNDYIINNDINNFSIKKYNNTNNLLLLEHFNLEMYYNDNMLFSIDDGNYINRILYNNSIHNVPYNKYVNLKYSENWNPGCYFTGNYYTLGTNKMDWYIPSITELNIIVEHIQQINNTLKNIKNAEQLNMNENYMSSTFYDKYQIFYVNMINCSIIADFSSLCQNIRPIIKINSNII